MPDALRTFTRHCNHDNNSRSGVSIRLVKSDQRVSGAYSRVHNAGQEGLGKLTAAFSWLFVLNAGVQELDAVRECV